MEISAQLVKTLREKTGSGMMDCKRALVESAGNIEEAIDLLRKKGLMDAAKKSSRVAADGLIAFALSEDCKTGSMVEINSETDFVARNTKFQTFVSNIANIALKTSEVEEILSSPYPLSEQTVRQELDLLISLIGENITIRRAEKVSVKNGMISAYVHNAIAPSMGKIGVLVALESSGSCSGCNVEMKNNVSEFGKKIAMHIAAASPAYLLKNDVPESVIARERAIILEQSAALGSEIANKKANGKIVAFIEECVLLEQDFIMDRKVKIHEAIEAFNKEKDCILSISEFKKFVLGEGIEKIEVDFAEEVKSFIK